MWRWNFKSLNCLTLNTPNINESIFISSIAPAFLIKSNREKIWLLEFRSKNTLNCELLCNICGVPELNFIFTNCCKSKIFRSFRPADRNYFIFCSVCCYEFNFPLKIIDCDTMFIRFVHTCYVASTWTDTNRLNTPCVLLYSISFFKDWNLLNFTKVTIIFEVGILVVDILVVRTRQFFQQW